VNKAGTLVVVGGECNDNAVCTGSNLPDPIIELYDTTKRESKWTKQISIPSFRSVHNIKFSNDTSKIAAVLSLDRSEGLMIVVLDSNGVL
jgi:hypothetical protein